MLHNTSAMNKNVNSDKAIALIVVVSFLLMIFVNALANILPINGVTTSGVSDSFPSLFTPAASIFAIWGLIYLLLAGFSIFQFEDRKLDNSLEKLDMINKIRIYFIISSVVNMAWLFAWHNYLIWLSVVLMFALLVCLLQINRELHREKLTQKELVFFRLPFSVYLAWVAIAAIGNIMVFLVSIGWNQFGLSEDLWTILAVGVGFILSLILMFYFTDITYALVALWAYGGILLKHISPDYYNSRYPSIIVAVIFSMSLLMIAIVYLLIMKKKNPNLMQLL